MKITQICPLGFWRLTEAGFQFSCILIESIRYRSGCAPLIEFLQTKAKNVKRIAVFIVSQKGLVRTSMPHVYKE